jgi:hypothetical protein
MNWNDLPWEEKMKQMHSGEVVEVSEDFYDYHLDVLPPVSMGKVVEIPQRGKVRTDFGFAEGADYIVYFWRRTEEDGRKGYRAWQSKQMASGW